MENYLKLLRFSKPDLDQLYKEVQEWKQKRKGATVLEELAVRVERLIAAAEVQQNEVFPVYRLTVDFNLDDIDRLDEELEKLKGKIKDFVTPYDYLNTDKNKEKMVTIFLNATLEEIEVALNGAKLLDEIKKNITDLTTILEKKKDEATAYWHINPGDMGTFTLPKNPGGSDPESYSDVEISCVTTRLRSLIIKSNKEDEVTSAADIRNMKK